MGIMICDKSGEIEFTDKWDSVKVLELVGELFNKDEDMNKGDKEV